ncbi:hypothetical protein N8944_03190 [Pseudomonadales bacterium]|nr:hypothetical protein [Pseudomonadales bacterium]MDA7784852.1 hypothetical protein [Pseudomonadales bacterium]
MSKRFSRGIDNAKLALCVLIPKLTRKIYVVNSDPDMPMGTKLAWMQRDME